MQMIWNSYRIEGDETSNMKENSTILKAVTEAYYQSYATQWLTNVGSEYAMPSMLLICSDVHDFIPDVAIGRDVSA